MTNGISSELQSMLNQAMAQLQSISASETSSNGEKEPQFINSIHTFAQNTQGLIDEDASGEQKAKASVKIIEGLMNMISFSQNQQAKANQEVKSNDNAISNNDRAAAKISSETQSKINEYAGNIANHSENIQNAIEDLNTFKEAKDEEIQEKEQEILEQLEIIETNKKNLSDPEKREEALAAISAAANIINEGVNFICQAVLSMQTEVEKQNDIVENNLEQITTSLTDSAAEISEGTADLQEYMQKNGVEAGKATQTATQGGVDVPTGNAEVSAGQTINSNAFSALASGGQGAKLIMDGNQRIGAGQTRIQGGVKNLSAAMQGIGRMGQDVSSLSNYTNALGQVGNGVIDLVGEYGSAADAYISSIGTYNIEAICQANEELQNQVKIWQEGKSEGASESQETQSNAAEIEAEGTMTAKFKSAFGL